MTPLIDYIQHGILPDDRAEARALVRKSAKYVLDGGVLYRRSLSHPYYRCLPENEAHTVLSELHEGECGDHLGWRNLVGKILRLGYYWPTLKTDAKVFVQNCIPCQKFGNIPRVPATELTPVRESWPFA